MVQDLYLSPSAWAGGTQSAGLSAPLAVRPTGAGPAPTLQPYKITRTGGGGAPPPELSWTRVGRARGRGGRAGGAYHKVGRGGGRSAAGRLPGT